MKTDRRKKRLGHIAQAVVGKGRQMGRADFQKRRAREAPMGMARWEGAFLYGEGL